MPARNNKLREVWTPEERCWQSGKCVSTHLWDNSVKLNCAIDYWKKCSHLGLIVLYNVLENCWPEALNCFSKMSHLLWSRVFYYPSVSDFPCPTLSVNYSMIVQTSVENGDFLFYKMLSSNWSISVPFSLCVWTYFLKYLNFPSVLKLLCHPLFRWRGSCPFAELYCNHFSFINIIFTWLIVYRACNNFNTVLWKSLGFSTRGDLRSTREWSVLSVTLLLPTYIKSIRSVSASCIRSTVFSAHHTL